MELSAFYLVIPIVVLTTAAVTVWLMRVITARRTSQSRVCTGTGLSGDACTIIEESASGICIVDHDEKIVFANSSFAEIIGRDPEELRDISLATFLEASEFEKMKQRTQVRRKDSGYSVYDAQVIRKDNQIREVIVCANPLVIDDVEQNLVLGVVIDITERKQYENRLIEMDGVFENTSEGIVITTPAGVITRVNPAFSKITGFDASEALGKTPRILKSNHHKQGFYKDLWSTLIRDGRWSGEIWNRRKTGEAYPQWMSITAIKNSGNETSHYVSIFRDISEIKRNVEKLSYQANHDALTGLPNRMLFEDRLGRALARARRAEKMVAVIFLDLDDFKMINDTLGHPAGDLVLQEVAHRLKTCLREGDTAARLGGDEFILLLPELDDRTGAMNIIPRINTAIAAPFSFQGIEISSSASIGITFYPEHGDDPQTLHKNADSAMYRAKENGKNGFAVYSDELDEKASLQPEIG